MAGARNGNPDLIEVRRSKVHGLGVFAAQEIPKGSRLIEYVGEHVSHDEADRRYEDKDEHDSHTFLFIVDSKTVIDAGVDGNDARFFNHSCDPNCESVIDGRRVFIEAIRDIGAGAELTYDYQIQREDDDPDNIDEVFACRCGFAQCRGTMLWPTERKPKRGRAKQTAAARRKTSGSRKKTGSTRTAAGRSAATRKSALSSRRTPGRKAASGKRSASGRKSVSGRGSASHRNATPRRKTAPRKRSVAAKKGGRRR